MPGERPGEVYLSHRVTKYPNIDKYWTYIHVMVRRQTDKRLSMENLPHEVF